MYLTTGNLKVRALRFAFTSMVGAFLLSGIAMHSTVWASPVSSPAMMTSGVSAPDYNADGPRLPTEIAYVCRGGHARRTMGLVTAATAASWSGAPPASGSCWHYVDPSKEHGFWGCQQ